MWWRFGLIQDRHYNHELRFSLWREGGQKAAMLVILDGKAPSGEPRRLAFRQPKALIRAGRLSEVPGALLALEAARASGHWLAGAFFYELGYALEKRLEPALPPGGPLLLFGVYDGPGQAPPETGRAYAGPLMPEWDAAAYGMRFRAVKEAIAAGDIYQANLSFRASLAFAGDARALYEQLRATAEAPHCAYLDDNGHQLLSLSPELFFRDCGRRHHQPADEGHQSTPGGRRCGTRRLGGIAQGPRRESDDRGSDPQ